MKYKQRVRHHALATTAILLLLSCSRNPVDRLTNPIPGGAVPGSSGVYVIFQDELFTAGGLGFVPSGGNQSITLQDQSLPRLDTNQIKYDWSGQPVNGQQLFAGFSLLITPDFTTLSAAPAKDLRAAGYTKLVMSVRGNLSAQTTLKIDGPTDTARTAAHTVVTSLSSDWREVTLSGIPLEDFAAVKVFCTLTFQYAQPAGSTNPGEGGTVYVDRIRYEK